MKELEQQAQLAMNVLLTAAFVLVAFILSVVELGEGKFGELKSFAIFGVTLPTNFTPLLLLLIMAAAELYFISICAAIISQLGIAPSQEKSGACRTWLFFQPGDLAPRLGYVWLFLPPGLHALTLVVIFIGGWREWTVFFVIELPLLSGLVVVARWGARRAMSARRLYLALPPTETKN